MLFSLIQFTTTQKLVLLVTVPVMGFLLYLLLRPDEEEEDDDTEVNRLMTSRQTVIEVKVPLSVAGAIIGPQGSRIKQIEEATGARLNMKDEVDRDSKERTVVIRGAAQSAQQAEVMVHRIVAEQPEIISEVIRVPQKALGRIIGRNGDTIRELSRISKARIIIDRSTERRPDGTQQVTLKGSAGAIEYAKGLIDEKVQEEEESRAKIAVSAAGRQQRHRQHKGDDAAKQGTDTKTVGPGGDGANISRERDEGGSEWEGKWPANRDYLEVYVSAIEHPGHFWVQLVNALSTRLDQLTQEMTAYYTNPESSQMSRVDKFSVGDIIVTPFEHDRSWYRARISEILEGDQIDVYYVDFGDSGIVSMDSVKTIRGDFLSLPFQAFECCLAHVQPTDGEEWSEEAKDLFEDLSHTAKWKVVIAHTVSYRQVLDQSMPCIELVDTNGPTDVDVAEELVKRGYAQWVKEEDSATQNGEPITSKTACAPSSYLYKSIQHGTDD